MIFLNSTSNKVDGNMSSGMIKGKCGLMCPERESKMREKEGLLHKFEIDDASKHLRKPKADKQKIIKCFSRSAAGQLMTDPFSLRPGPILISTINYLFTKIAIRTDVNWVEIYDFIFDRLRSIRQDATIQRLDLDTYIKVLEPIVCFHIYSSQRLCERTINEFDNKINNQHLLECLKQLISMYDDRDLIENERSTFNDADLEIRSEFESFYVLLNIGDTSALNRVINLPLKIRQNHIVSLAAKTSLAWYLKNYVLTIRLIQQFPTLHICAALNNLRIIRRNALKVMSVAYNSSILKVPTSQLEKLLLYKNVKYIKADCELFNIELEDELIMFKKNSFNNSILLANPQMYFTSQYLHNLLPSILLPNIKVQS